MGAGLAEFCVEARVEAGDRGERGEACPVEERRERGGVRGGVRERELGQPRVLAQRAERRRVVQSRRVPLDDLTEHIRAS